MAAGSSKSRKSRKSQSQPTTRTSRSGGDPLTPSPRREARSRNSVAIRRRIEAVAPTGKYCCLTLAHPSLSVHTTPMLPFRDGLPNLKVLGRLWGCPPTTGINVNSRYNVAIISPQWHEYMDKSNTWCLIPEEPIIRYLHGIYCPPATATMQPPDLYSLFKDNNAIRKAIPTLQLREYSPPSSAEGQSSSAASAANPIPIFSYRFLPLPGVQYPPLSRSEGVADEFKHYDGPQYVGVPEIESHLHPYFVIWKAGYVLRHNEPGGRYTLPQLLEFRGISGLEIDMIKNIYHRWTQTLAEQSGTSSTTTPTTTTSTATTTTPSTSASHATYDAGSSSNTQGNPPSLPSAPPSSRENPDPPQKRQRQSSPPSSDKHNTRTTRRTRIYNIMHVVSQGVQKHLEKPKPRLRSENGGTKRWDGSKPENQLHSENLEKLGSVSAEERVERFLILATDPVVDTPEERVAPYLLRYREDRSTDAPEKALLRGPDWWEFLWAKPRVYHRIRQENRKRQELC